MQPRVVPLFGVHNPWFPGLGKPLSYTDFWPVHWADSDTISLLFTWWLITHFYENQGLTMGHNQKCLKPNNGLYSLHGSQIGSDVCHGLIRYLALNTNEWLKLARTTMRPHFAAICIWHTLRRIWIGAVLVCVVLYSIHLYPESIYVLQKL